MYSATKKEPLDKIFAFIDIAGKLLAEKGDILLFGGIKKKDKKLREKLFKELIFGISILSFLPGGITIFGKHLNQIIQIVM